MDQLLFLVSLVVTPVLALPSNPPPTPVVEDRAASPTVVISPSNTVVGSIAIGSGIEQYNGIFYADEPTGSLRLKPPQKLSTDLGDAFDASGLAGACPQMLISTGDDQSLFFEIAGDLLSSTIAQKATGQSENCLSVDVARPKGTVAGAGLPVLFWIFGGAFEVSRYLDNNPRTAIRISIEQNTC